METIVWATDGSPNADHALEVAKALLHGHEASLVVVHVVQRYATETGLAVYADEELVKSRLDQRVAELEQEGFKVDLRIVNHIGPQPGHEITKLAGEVGADLIVMGTRGHGPIPGIPLGSTVMRVLQTAPCPVVAVPAPASAASD